MWRILPYKIDVGERYILGGLMRKITKVVHIPLIGYLTFYIKDIFREGDF